MNWREKARCYNHPKPEIFWVADTDSHPDLGAQQIKRINNLRTHAALSVCRHCSVRRECREDATGKDMEVTVRGGEPARLGRVARGRPRKSLKDEAVREEMADLLLGEWMAGYTLGDALARLDLPRAFMDSSSWRNRYRKVATLSANALITPPRGRYEDGRPFRAAVLASDPGGEVYSYVKVNSRGVAVRLFLPAKHVRIDPGCSIPKILVTWP